MSLLFSLPSLPFHKIGSPFTSAAYCSSFLLFLFSISCLCCMSLVALPCQLLCYLHLRASLFSAAGMPLKSNLLSYFLFLEITQLLPPQSYYCSRETAWKKFSVYLIKQKQLQQEKNKKQNKTPPNPILLTPVKSTLFRFSLNFI